MWAVRSLRNLLVRCSLPVGLAVVVLLCDGTSMPVAWLAGAGIVLVGGEQQLHLAVGTKHRLGQVGKDGAGRGGRGTQLVELRSTAMLPWASGPAPRV